MNSRLRNFLTTGSLGSDEEKPKEVPPGTPTVEPAKPTPAPAAPAAAPTVEPAVKQPAPAPAAQNTAGPAAALEPRTEPAPAVSERPAAAVAPAEPAVKQPAPTPAPTVRPSPTVQTVPTAPAVKQAAPTPTVRPSPTAPPAPYQTRPVNGTPIVTPVNPSRTGEMNNAVRSELAALKTEVAELKTAAVQSQAVLRSDYLTNRDQLKIFQTAFERRDAEIANKQLMSLLEQVSMMREDFFRLCDGMTAKIGNFTAQEVLDSFKAYEVDMENILHDAGVVIGPYGDENTRINTLHQRIVGIVPTNDPNRNGRIAERLADGYEYHGRVLLKEKVNVFKTTEIPLEPAPAVPAAGPDPAPAPAAEAAVPAAAPAPAEPAAEKKRAPRKRRSGKKSVKSAENTNELTDGNKTKEE